MESGFGLGVSKKYFSAANGIAGRAKRIATDTCRTMPNAANDAAGK
jgi:hypothetical protein